MDTQATAPAPQPPTPAPAARRPPLGRALAWSIVPTTIVGVAGVWWGVHVIETYGWLLFFGLPFLVAMVSAFTYRCLIDSAGFGESFSVSLGSLGAVALMLFAVAMEGALCLLMAMPPALAMGALGAAAGYGLASQVTPRAGWSVTALLLVAFPLLSAFEGSFDYTPPVHQVVSRVVINAPIQTVWDEVIGFDEITKPPRGIFRMGIAYPVRARIEGEGVGAMRYCEFSTGPFVEPITRWDPPHALEFDVVENPAPMREVSLWGAIEPPHLHGTFTSTRGQFRLSEEDGRTILEGTTWYSQRLYPDFYWSRLSNRIIHLIHLRVLEHIRDRAEMTP